MHCQPWPARRSPCCSRFRDAFEDPKAPGSSLVVLRLTRLELKQHTKDNSVPPVLFCTGHSV